ncbi:hypothetical protein [Vibrio sp. YIC-376]|uniref:hypothetical protein n=1 Tax=Vibrio sp. YIC-376 TaxID=3136162 RepID=UPI00402A6833
MGFQSTKRHRGNGGEDIALKASNTGIPLSIVAHKNGNLIGTLELKFRENKNYPEYEHWLVESMFLLKVGEMVLPKRC